jgi:hypothetical protein
VIQHDAMEVYGGGESGSKPLQKIQAFSVVRVGPDRATEATKPEKNKMGMSPQDPLGMRLEGPLSCSGRVETVSAANRTTIV